MVLFLLESPAAGASGISKDELAGLMRISLFKSPKCDVTPPDLCKIRFEMHRERCINDSSHNLPDTLSDDDADLMMWRAMTCVTESIKGNVVEAGNELDATALKVVKVSKRKSEYEYNGPVIEREHPIGLDEWQKYCDGRASMIKWADANPTQDQFGAKYPGVYVYTSEHGFRLFSLRNGKIEFSKDDASTKEAERIAGDLGGNVKMVNNKLNLTPVGAN